MSFGIAFNIRDNQSVRIDGRAYVAGGATDAGRRFTARETGEALTLSSQAMMRMAREGRITSEAMREALTKGVREALEIDWDGFTTSQRLVAQMRKRFVDAIEASRVGAGLHKKHIEAAVTEVMDDREDPPTCRRPTARSVRRWHLTYVAAGRDIRALVDLSFNRGCRDDRMPKWMVEELDRAIGQVYATAPAGSMAATRTRAVTLIRQRMERDNLALPDLGQKDILGKNAVARRLKHWERYDVLQRQVGRAEADRVMTAVGIGPQGEPPLSEVEVDHTLLDVLVVGSEDGQVYGRPWLTALVDRYSRCIVGFSVTFHPPSWTSVMGALRHAVSDKAALVADLGGIHSAWECQGVPEELVCDNGKDFHSTSMRETSAALSMRVLYVPRRKGWLKGKVERFFRTLEGQLIHALPGTTLSNVLERKHYDAETFAVLSIQQLNWLVTKYVVDVYHQTEHKGLGDVTPAERWRSGVRQHGMKLPPDPGLIKPLTGLVVRGSLSRTGVQYKELRWNSNGFSGLLNRLKNGSDVQIRVDTMDLSRAFVFDEDRRRWVEGDLITRDVAEGLTLHQYLVVRSHAKQTRLHDETKAAALSRAHGEIFDFVQKVKQGGKKAEKKFARFAEDGRKPSEHIAQGVRDTEASRARLGSHPLDGGATEPPRVPARPPRLPQGSDDHREIPAMAPTGRRALTHRPAAGPTGDVPPPDADSAPRLRTRFRSLDP